MFQCLAHLIRLELPEGFQDAQIRRVTDHRC